MKKYIREIRFHSCPLPINLFFYISVLLTLFLSCTRTNNLADTILNDRKSFYHINAREYPTGNRSLPIGIFDSGTGGLATLNDILNFRVSGNQEKINHPDSLFPFSNESFIFLADLANMPYGSYSIENNISLLIEHILKDVQFLLGNKYYQRADSPVFMTDKSPVKAIVIACNTATAYGLDTIKRFLESAGLDMGVIGVIDAGTKGAFSNFSPGENGSIAILATDATVKSGAYMRSVNSCKEINTQYGSIDIFQQAGIGIAEAIDENTDFIDRSASLPRSGYKGPTETGTGEMKIDMTKWKQYHFKMSDQAMLYEGDSINPHKLQINSAENYISFHLVTLMEKMRNDKDPEPLNSVVLACTHYPYFEETFRNTISRLRDYRENGEYIYKSLIAEDFIIVNPAIIVAEQLYDYLTENNLLNKKAGEKSEFYITVPNVLNRNVILREDGTFSYEYKYGRKAGEIQEYVKCVPFSNSVIQRDILTRLSSQVPLVYERIVGFNHDHPKTTFLKKEERIIKP